VPCCSGGTVDATATISVTKTADPGTFQVFIYDAALDGSVDRKCVIATL
jgi:hypothetical protein